MTDLSSNAAVRVYAAGGCGTNIAKYFEDHRGRSTKGFAAIDVCYVDTSLSNAGNGVSKDDMYHLDGLDGSGKVRRENAERISEAVLNILQQFKPQTINIVLSSAGGGSGSVIAPSLVSELLKRGLPTIVMIVGQNDPVIELDNTIKTIKSYEAIAKLRRTPVNAMYFENSKETPRSKVDHEVRSAISVIAALFSKQNKELDSSDLQNWLNYTKVTSYEPHLTYMNFNQGGELDIPKNSSVISVATLITEDIDSAVSTTVDYQCVGIVEKEVFQLISDNRAIHCVNIDGVFTHIHDRLTKRLQDVNAEKQARIVKTNILSDKDQPNEDGLVY